MVSPSITGFGGKQYLEKCEDSKAYIRMKALTPTIEGASMLPRERPLLLSPESSSSFKLRDQH
jgi:hypothetical protein